MHTTIIRSESRHLEQYAIKLTKECACGRAKRRDGREEWGYTVGKTVGKRVGTRRAEGERWWQKLEMPASR